jgi:hypothetical protein
MSTDTSLITFKAIANFANDLAEVFGDNQRSLKLYAHLISKTTLSHDKPIQKHIEAFRNFCVANRDAISARDYKILVEKRITYSDRVYINIPEIFKKSDAETSGIIWKHLLTISALVDPTGKAREILKEQTTSGTGVGEANFLTDIISKVESHVDPNANPMEAVASIMKSGIFNDLVSGMGSGLQDGSLDLGKLMSTVQTMVTKLSDETGDSDGGKQAVNMINTMIGSLNAGAAAGASEGASGNEQQMPDLSAMLGPMMAMMGGGSGGNGGMPDLANMMSALNGLGIQVPSNDDDDESDSQLLMSKARRPK